MVGGGTPDTKKPEYWDGDIPWISSADIHALRKVTPRRSITQLGINSSATNLVPEGSLIIVTRVGLGKVAIAPTELCFSQDSQALVENNYIFRDYALYYLSTAVQSFKHQSRGTTISGVTKKQLSELPFLLPPLNEQRRIVEKIEELFTKLDAGVRSLKQAQALLKSYRCSVLKAAVERELSREWREAHGDEMEPASELLEQILRERREKLAGKKYKEPAVPDTSELPTLPDGWAWARLEQLGDVIGGLTKNRKRDGYPLQLPYLRVANVYANELRLDDVEEIGVEDSELSRVLLEDRDLLVVEGNGSPDQIGRVALWDVSISPCVHQNHLIKVRFFQTDVSRYALHWLLSSEGREYIKRVASSTSGLYTLSLSKVKALPIPLSPLKEQRIIVEEVERRLSVVDKLEATVEENLKQADALRQSILKLAFSGELVPQDPDDEPASVLLERIRSEREAAKPKFRKGRKSNARPARGGQTEQGGLF